MKKLLSIVAIVIALSIGIGSESLATTPSMLRVWVNGTAVMDSKVSKNILKATEENLGKSIVIEVRDEENKGTTVCPDQHVSNVKNISITKLGKMFRVLLNGNAVVDSRIPSVILSVVEEVIAEKMENITIEILPRIAVYNQQKAIIQNIMELAKQGKVLRSGCISLGSTRNNVIQKFGKPVEEMEGLLPGTRELLYPNGVGAMYTDENKKVTQLSSCITGEFKQIMYQEDVVRVLGKPHKITKLSKEEMKKFAKKKGNECLYDLTVMPLYTYKAGKNYLHFIEVDFEVEKDVFIQMTLTVVDENCETLAEIK